MIDHNINRRGLMLVLSAPSGTGKTTLSKLLQKHDKHINISISTTTREKRENELNEIDYTFVTEKKFKKMIDENKFLEYAEIFDNYYGTPREQVENLLSNGEDVLFDIDWKGHRQLTAIAREDVSSIFILPPSKDELLKRLKARNQDSIEVLRKRMDQLNLEINHWHEYDYVIINKNINDTLQKIICILKAERLKKARRIGLSGFISNFMQQTLNEDIK